MLVHDPCKQRLTGAFAHSMHQQIIDFTQGKKVISDKQHNLVPTTLAINVSWGDVRLIESLTVLN